MYRKILLAIDARDSDESRRILEQGVRLVEEGGELYLATVFSPGGSGFFPHVSEDSPENREKVVRDKLNLLAHKYLPMAQDAHLHVMCGKAGEKLVALAANIEAELMIMVSRGETSLWPLRKATLEYILENSPCPMLVLPVDKTPAAASK